MAACVMRAQFVRLREARASLIVVRWPEKRGIWLKKSLLDDDDDDSEWFMVKLVAGLVLFLAAGVFFLRKRKRKSEDKRAHEIDSREKKRKREKSLESTLLCFAWLVLSVIQFISKSNQCERAASKTRATKTTQQASERFRGTKMFARSMHFYG